MYFNYWYLIIIFEYYELNIFQLFNRIVLFLQYFIVRYVFLRSRFNVIKYRRVLFIYEIYCLWNNCRNLLFLNKQSIKQLYFKFENITIFSFISSFITFWEKIEGLYINKIETFINSYLKTRITNREKNF